MQNKSFEKIFKCLNQFDKKKYSFHTKIYLQIKSRINYCPLKNTSLYNLTA